MQDPEINILGFKCPVCGSTNTRTDLDSPNEIACCIDCGCDFMQDDDEILFDPRKL